MKKKNRLLSLLLALLIAGAMLVSCVTNQPGGEDDNSTDDVTPANDLVLVADGESKSMVIRSVELDGTSGQVICAGDIRKAIGDTTKVFPKFIDDFTKDGKHDPNAIEILVGNTNYEETKSILALIGYDQYMVKVVGNKLVVAAYSDNAIITATNELISKIKSLAEEGSLIIPGDLMLTGSADKRLAALPIYEGGSFSASYIGGGEAPQIIIKDTNAEQYQNYLKKLEANGFTEYTTNQIKDNCFATYNNDAYTVNAGFYKYENSARIIIESLAKPAGLEADNVYTPVTTSQITMLGLSFKKSDGNMASNGLSILIRLTDGRFIIIDGGFNRSQCASNIIAALKDQSKGYIGPGEKITIAAWIITHAHSDHSGMLANHYSSFTSFKIERILINSSSTVELARGASASTNVTVGEAGGYSGVLNAARTLNADLHIVRVGQVFYFADLKLEVLYTIDSYGPNLLNAYNTSSVVMKMTFGDGTVYMSTGDVTGIAMQIIAKMYGDYLKSDIVQVAHHGLGCYGTESGMIAAYNHMAPSTLLWPVATEYYTSVNTNSYNIVLFSSANTKGGLNPNFKEVFVAEKEGDTITVPIPYSVGSAIVNRS